MNPGPKTQSADSFPAGENTPQQALYESQKRQVVGALAGGVAHDFNNILTAVICRLELALADEQISEETRNLLAQALDSARRGADLNTKLLAFSRHADRKPAPLNVVQLIEEAVFILRRTIDRRIHIQFSPPKDKLWTAMADSDQFIQALMNLCLNARDAMPEGGQLSIVCANRAFDGQQIQPPQRAGEFVQITVGDTGSGMTPEVLSRLFEPYFSTKGFGKGAGLGLSIANHVVVEHGGWMEVESKPDFGSRFHFFLPRTDVAASATEPADRRDGIGSKVFDGKETVLLVDDEHSVRTVVRAMLSYRGYKVVEAADGEEALRRFKESTQKIDLILLDLQMPRMNGWDTLDRILEINPKARVLLLSGGNFEPPSGRTLNSQAMGVIAKPFQGADLLRAIREILDGSTSSSETALGTEADN